MKSIYKRLGDFIREIKVRNAELKAEKLLGINIDKFFMPSVANVVGTDMSVYKIVRKNQFACNRMHVGRDYRLPISMSKTDDEFMVSPAYDVFEILDTDIISPEYLMMWFSRREFDRNAWFYTDADVRGGLNWKAFCDMQLPIPSITKQRKIVKEYNFIQNRIDLNQKLIQKLEETAQAIYKQWFVDFEFPDEKGKPYKSNGGEMVESEFGEIPKGWEVGTLEKVSNQLMGFAFKGEQYVSSSGVSVLRGENVSEKFLRWDNHKKWNDEITLRIEKCYLKENDIVIGMDGSKVGKNWAVVSKYDLPLLLAQRVSCLRGKKKAYQNFIFYSMCVLDFENYVSQVQTGTSIPHISGQQIFNFPMLIANDFIIEKFDIVVSKMVTHKSNIVEETKKLTEMKDLLLSKLATIEN
jgi:type I restriction enzyme S subunit